MKRSPYLAFIRVTIYCILLLFISCQKDSEIFNEVIANDIDNNNNDPEEDTATTLTFDPLDDAFLQGESGFNQNIVRVEANERTTYLKFDLSTLENTPSKAYLEFTTDSDAGNGRLEASVGIGNNWTEENLSPANVPGTGAVLGEIDGTYTVGSTQRIELDVTTLESEVISIVLEKKSGNDISIASKENRQNPGPKLVLEFGNGGGGNDQETTSNDDPPGEGNNVIALNDLRAFPSAMGAGAFARVDPDNAIIYEVTNLNTQGPGSFREAFEAEGPRIIIVKVEGRIDDNNAYSEMGDTSGDIAVWGQFAPGLGLTVRHPRMTFSRAGNIIFRFLTLQSDLGLPCTVNEDCFDPLNYLQVENGSSNYVDHCSMRYGLDQIWTLNVNTHSQPGDSRLNRSTFAYNLLAEGDPEHNTASILNRQGDTPTSTDIGQHTWSRNMTYNVSHRFPNLNTNGDFEKYNNFIVNWAARLSRYNVTPNVDYHRNYNKRGNVTLGLGEIERRGNKLNQGADWGNGEPSLYSAFNIMEGLDLDTSSNLQTELFTWFDTESTSYYGVRVVEDGPVPVEFFRSAQQFSFNPPADGYWDANQVPQKAMSSVGHNRGINANGTPFYGYDDLDRSYITKTRTNTTESRYRDTGQWTQSSFPGTGRYQDSDGDNMPDWFEDQFPFLDKNDASDMLETSNVNWNFNTISAVHDYVVVNNAGYTNLEICAAFYAGDFETMIDGTNNLAIND